MGLGWGGGGGGWGGGGGGMLGHNKINSQILIYFFSKMAGWGVSGEIFFIFPGLHRNWRWVAEILQTTCIW